MQIIVGDHTMMPFLCKVLFLQKSLTEGHGVHSEQNYSVSLYYAMPKYCVISGFSASVSFYRVHRVYRWIILYFWANVWWYLARVLECEYEEIANITETQLKGKMGVTEQYTLLIAISILTALHKMEFTAFNLSKLKFVISSFVHLLNAQLLKCTLLG